MGDVADGGEKVRRLSAACMMARPCDVSLRCIITGDVSTRLLPSGDLIDAANPLLWTVPSTAKSRYQEVETYANQTSATFTFETLGWKHTLITGAEFSREDLSRDSYLALATEAFGASSIPGSSLNLWNPRGVDIPWTGQFIRTGRPTQVTVDTASAYALDTINIQDRFFLSGAPMDDGFGRRLVTTLRPSFTS